MRLPSKAVTSLLVFALAGLVSSAPRAADATADAYRLAVGDRVSVTAFGRADLTGEFLVGSDAAIRLPMLGAIPAAGLSRAEVEAAVAERLSKMLGYDTTVTVDVAAYRPVYVIGDITTPGEVAYVPGMTTLQAYAKAGGTPSLRQLPGQIASQVAAAQRDLMAGQAELNSLLVHRAALEAALAGRTEIALPGELQAIAQSPAVEAVMAAEKALLEAGRQDLEARASLTAKQRVELGEEVAALEKQIATLKIQSDAVAEEVSRIGGLAEKGLATSQRMLELKRTKASTDSSRYEAAAFLSRALQESIQLDLSLHEARQKLRHEFLEERRLLEGQIAQARVRVQGAARQMTALSQVNPADMSGGSAEIAMAISRTDGDGFRTFVATATTPLQPGDIVQVTMQASGSAGLPHRQASASSSVAD